MRFIEGIGYVTDTYTNPIQASKSNTTSEASFQDLLVRESIKLSDSDISASDEKSLDDIFREASDTYGVSYDLLKAIAYNESGFRPDATSYVGAMGIMQLMPSTAASLGVTDAYDPYQNIMGGAKLLSQLSKMYNGDQTLMIAAYNAGPGNVAKYGGIPPFKETQNYVAKVLKTLEYGTANANTTYPVNASNIWSSYQPSTNSSGSTLTEEALDKLFSYSDYERLIRYFDQMLRILSDLNIDFSTNEEEKDPFFG
ncbi:MAG: lytic transglycosylase domain-containing protein [Lachnospiraceae bacterium]|nr:lytic transglycosylase domain-containing protein [Lachnospiraceae bacterium]